MNELGTVVEWFWQDQPAVLREKTVHATFSITDSRWTALQSESSVCASHGTAKRRQIADNCEWGNYMLCTCCSLNGNGAIRSWWSDGQEVGMRTTFWFRNIGKTWHRPLHRWEDNIEIDYTEGGWEVVDWVCVIHNSVRLLAILKMVMNI